MRRSLRVVRAAGLLGPSALGALVPGLLAARDGIGAVAVYAARRHGRSTAIDDDDRSISYAEILQRVSYVADGIDPFGTRGERVGVLMHNDIDSVVALFAAARCGLSVWPVDGRQRPASLSRLAADHRWSLMLSTDGSDTPGETVWQHDGFVLRRCMSPGAPDRRQLVILTGGTTGTPKGAGRRASAASMWAPFSALIDDVGLAAHRSAYLSTPLHHGFGLSALLVGMVLGTRLHLAARSDAETVEHTIQRHRPEVLVAVPTVLQRLLARADNALDGVRTVVSGSAPLPAPVTERLLHRSGTRLFHLFGSSEAGLCALATPEMLRTHPGTIGRAIPGIGLRIVAGDGTEVVNGGVGVLQVRSRAATARGWVTTGDLAHRDDGLLHLDGRVDDIIQSGGVSVAPAELERVLSTHPGISECAVVAIPDPDLGHGLAAFVVGRGESLVTDEVADWLRARVPHPLQPRRIRAIAALPLTPAQKIDHRELRRRACEDD